MTVTGLGGRLAPQQSVGNLQAFGVERSLLPPQDDPRRLSQFAQQFEEQLLPMRDRQTGELYA